ncbi:MAG: hypothetical protein E7450_05985 [Ruminococcaceae bacterium]|nr:hypothetical protein [Oscillospiraceae bacterium]
MKKTMSFLLALIMVVSMVPGTAVSVSAAEEVPALQAYYTRASMAVDGKLIDGHWLMRDKVGNTPITLLCNQDSLFIGMKTTAKTADFTVNGVALQADFEAGSVVSNGVKVGVAATDLAAGTVELDIPLVELGLQYSAGQTVDFACKVAGDSFTGKAILAEKAALVAQSMDDISLLPNYKKMGTPGKSQIYGEQGEGSLHIGTGPMTDAGASLHLPEWSFTEIGFDKTKGYELSYTIDFNDLTVSGPGQEAYVAVTGFGIETRSGVYNRQGFSADKDGNILVSQYERTPETTKTVDTGYDLGAKNVFVQMIVDDDYNTAVYMDGKLIIQYKTSARTADGDFVRTTTSTARRDTTLPNGNDINIHDLLLTQTAPDEQLVVSDFDSKDLKLDGSAAEMVWAMTNKVSGTKFALLRDEENLYIALNSDESQVELLLNGSKAVAKLGKRPTIALGYTMGSTIATDGNGQYEITIPLSLLGDFGATLPFVITAGGQTRKFALSLTGKSTGLVTKTPAAGDGKQDATAYLNTDKVKMDGLLKENHWYAPYLTAGGDIATGVGFLWDATYLYVGGQMFSTTRAKSLNLTLGGKTVTADLANGTASAGEIANGGQTFEWKIALADLGIEGGINVAKNYKLDVVGQEGTSTLHGNLTMAATTVVLGDSCDDFNAKGYVNNTDPAVKGTRLEQGAGFYNITTDSAMTGNEIYRWYTPLLNYNGGAYEFTFDVTIHSLPHNTRSLGWRGLLWEIRQPELQALYAFRSDGKGNVFMDNLAARGCNSVDTGIDFGQRATIKIAVDDSNVPSLYVNGKFIGSFPILNRTTFTINDTLHMPRMNIQMVNHDRDPDADGKLNGTNIEIHDILFTQTLYRDEQGAAENALQTITEESILAGQNPRDVTKLNLVKEVTDPNSGITCDVVWSAVDTATGRPAENVNLETGVVSRLSRPVVFELTATVVCGSSGVSKSFTYQVAGQPKAGNVALITKDDDPRVGQVTSWASGTYEYLDTTHNSVVFDQGSGKQFNTIKLYDSDEFSRISYQHLGVFISDDGKNYTKVNGWLLHQNGKEYTLYNLSETARYVKVHCYHDALDNTGKEAPSFYNAVADMMTVSNNANLAGAGGAFAHKADYVVKNTTDKALKDYPAFVALADLGAKAGQYKSNGTDFRFTMGKQQLAYWFNGSDGFYVRVPELAAKGSTTITAHWGCSSAEDFSDAEAVFEVVYGNVSLYDLTNETGLGSHGRPFTFSNGDIIVTGRDGGEGGTDGLVFVRSTDGGRTFHEDTEGVLSNLEHGGRAVGFGGYLYDEELDRVFLIAYSGAVGNDNDYRLVLIYTDDCGKTWSEPVYLTNPAVEKYRDNDSILQNADPNFTRVILYCDGIKVREADGDGPNVDYVIVNSGIDHVTNENKAETIYSCDAGKTWICGGMVAMDIDRSVNHEAGISEHSLSQLDDGSLYMLCRAQQAGNYYFYEARSYDLGKTWESGYSKVIASNTSPVAVEYNGERLLMWSSMNGLDGMSYRRTPMHLGISTDNYQSFDHIVDLTFATSYDGLEETFSHMIQPGITFTKDGKDAFVAFFDNNLSRRNVEKASAGFLVEEFSDMIHHTKGGYEDFETASLKFEGWMTVEGNQIELTREGSASGLQSMKVLDIGPGQAAHATRQIPTMKSGTVGAKMMVPAGNTEYFAMELKAGYNFTHMQHALAAVAVNGDGTVALCYDNEIVPVTKVSPGSWNDYAIHFDIATKTGKLYVNGKAVSDIKLETGEYSFGKKVEDVVREISCVQFMQISATPSVGDCLYVDDFYLTELDTPIKRSAYSIAFDDVKQGAWYYEAVDFAVENGIMSGYNADKFGPNDTLNRAMVVQVLYNKEGQPALNGMKHSFSDVPASQWFNNAVTWGSNRGVVSGFGGGVFKPEDAVTIEQVAVILWNYSNTPAGYGDLSEVGSHSDWAANALRWAVDKGLLNNVPFTNATEKATRAQTAQMLTNYLRGN